ncbi:MAG: hypothetical protein K0R37_1676 [Arthrobacter sp.]|nr:hypothetical protein [Arthrobacter sp.]
MTGNTESSEGTTSPTSASPAHDEEARDHELAQWSRRLTQALQILDLDVDRQLVARLAQESARAVNASAAPISALLVGYAAGLAAQNGEGTPNEAVQSAARTALQLCEHGVDGGPDSGGWTTTGQ